MDLFVRKNLHLKKKVELTSLTVTAQTYLITFLFE